MINKIKKLYYIQKRINNIYNLNTKNIIYSRYVFRIEYKSENKFIKHLIYSNEYKINLKIELI